MQMGPFASDHRFRNDAIDLAAAFQHGIGDNAHETHTSPAVYQAMTAFRKVLPQRDRSLPVTLVMASL
jgi:hypothetical protein